MNIEVRISRKSVMGIVEGISVTISQHNGGSPTFEQLWASDGESAKLDIYYREAISDLERRLHKQLVQSSSQWDLQAEGVDYVLRLTVAESWPTRLHGLLNNKVQDYLVHAVTAGWLNDFEGLSVQDYQSMAVVDLENVAYIASLKSFAFDEKARAGEEAKGENAYATSAGKRSSADAWKGVNAQATSAGKRHDGSDEAKADAGSLLNAGGRHEDDAEVRRSHEWVDWSGTHLGTHPHPLPKGGE